MAENDFGMKIKSGLRDWQIAQQINGVAELEFSGTWSVPASIIEMEAYDPLPSVRIVDEEAYMTILPWKTVDYTVDEGGFSGSWSCCLVVPAGGPYRIETGIDVKSPRKAKGWIVQGDVRFHVGVGDLFVIAGQSNAAGFAKDAAVDEPSMQVHLYRNRGAWDLACHPMTEFTDVEEAANLDKGVVGFSPFLAFGKMFHRFSHCPVGLVQTAMGGTSIEKWDPAREGSLYRNMEQRIRECGGRVAGILWYQGCTDSEEKESQMRYCQSFERMVGSLRQSLGYEVMFFTMQLNREFISKNDPYFGKIRNDQHLLAQTMPGVTLMTTLDCGLSDNIHNNAHSCIVLGERLAKQCAHYLYGARRFEPPYVERIVREQAVLRLELANINRYVLIVGEDPQLAGFTIEDEQGLILGTKLWVDKRVGNVLCIELERVPGPTAVISFAWEANPTRIPPVDDDTYLPLVSFYRRAF